MNDVNGKQMYFDKGSTFALTAEAVGGNYF